MSHTERTYCIELNAQNMCCTTASVYWSVLSVCTALSLRVLYLIRCL